MNPRFRTQLRVLDAALLSLLQERARLCARDPGPAAVDDLLRRQDGPLAAEDVRALFTLVERACARGGRP